MKSEKTADEIRTLIHQDMAVLKRDIEPRDAITLLREFGIYEGRGECKYYEVVQQMIGWRMEGCKRKGRDVITMSEFIRAARINENADHKKTMDRAISIGLNWILYRLIPWYMFRLKRKTRRDILNLINKNSHG